MIVIPESRSRRNGKTSRPPGHTKVRVKVTNSKVYVLFSTHLGHTVTYEASALQHALRALPKLLSEAEKFL